MTDDDIERFWERLESVNAGLLGTASGAARMVPMSHQLRDGDPTIWFITARDTDLAEAVEHGDSAATYVLADGSKGLYCVLQGRLIENRDPALRDDLWSVVADSWFAGGKDDPDVCILGLTPDSAEVWLSPTSGLSFLWGVARAQLTGTQPDMGSHGKLGAGDLTRLRRAA